MLVKILIGRDAGAVFDLRLDAAQSGIAMGTHVAATEEEIAAAGLAPPNSAAAAPAEVLPEGFEAKPTEFGGFLLFGPDGVQLRDEPFPNLSAARSFALEIVEKAAAADVAAKSAAEAEAKRLADEQAAIDAADDAADSTSSRKRK